ncbi:MAG: hypothetical protein R3E95_10930 [Thiolinea sp.]
MAATGARKACSAAERLWLPVSAKAADLPAHGASPLPEAGFGSLAFERCRRRRYCRKYAGTQFDLPAKPALLWGMSMGGAVAVECFAAADPQPWSALVVVSSFAELDSLLCGFVPERYAAGRDSLSGRDAGAGCVARPSAQYPAPPMWPPTCSCQCW